MARFEVAHNKAGVNTANKVMWQLRTSTTTRARVFEIGISIAVAPTTAPSWRLARATALGTSTATQAAEEEDPGGPTAVTLLDTTWSADPTPSATNMRLYATPITAGSGIVWTWPDHRPLIIPNAAASGICVVNANPSGATAGSFNIYCVFEE
jgi:L,D-peptidoglycan transpeptidase YkuD (ErfK/YbiS/YcfS/YnhG family)